jgi:hypothetical protein
MPGSLGTTTMAVFVETFGRDKNVGFQSNEARN